MELHIHQTQALGHLLYLWWWSLDYAPTGNLSAFTSAEISVAAKWPGDAKVFHENLKKTGWIDCKNKINDWMEYVGHYILSRRRQKRYRKKALALRNGDVTVTSNSTVPDSTNITKKNKSPPPPLGDSVRSGKFQKPTALETSAYARSIGFTLNGQQFVDFYESKGWVVGKSPMKNWKAAVRTWKANSSPGEFQKAEHESQVKAKNEKAEAEREAELKKHEDFKRDLAIVEKLPPDELRIIRDEALKRVPKDLKYGFDTVMMPAAMVEVYRERNGTKIE